MVTLRGIITKFGKFISNMHTVLMKFPGRAANFDSKLFIRERRDG
jgi:hypothetical protein